MNLICTLYLLGYEIELQSSSSYYRGVFTFV